MGNSMTVSRPALGLILASIAAFATIGLAAGPPAGALAPLPTTSTCAVVEPLMVRMEREGTTPQKRAEVSETAWRLEQQLEAVPDGNIKLLEQHHRYRVAENERVYGCSASSTIEALEDFADFLEQTHRRDEAFQLLSRVLNARRAMHPGGYDTMESWLAVIDNRQDGDHFDKARALLDQAIAEMTAHGGKSELKRLQAKEKSLERAVASQRLYDATQKVKTDPDAALRMLEGLDPTDKKVRMAKAQALEAKGDLKSAELLWRDAGDLDALGANLARQGRFAEAAVTAQAALDGRLEKDRKKASAETPEQRAFKEQQIKMFLESAAQLDKAGRPSEAESQRYTARLLQRQLDGEPINGDWRGEYRDLNDVADAIRIATWQGKAGDLAASAAALRVECPKLAPTSLADVKDPVARTHDGRAEFRSSDCYAALASAEAGLSATTPFATNSFMAAQASVETASGSALSAATARKYAIARGAGDLFARIDSGVSAERGIDKTFADTLPPADRQRLGMIFMDGQISPEEEADYQRLMYAMSAKASKRDLDRQPHEEVLKASYAELDRRFPEYRELRSPAPLTIEMLKGQAGPESQKLLAKDEALVLWMIPPGEEKGLVFAVSRGRQGWARIPLSGDQISKLVQKLRVQIDPCGLSPRPGCEAQPMAFDRRAAWTLHQVLLGDPAIQAVVGSGEINTLLIVPSGPMTTLPPSLLITDEPVDGSDKSTETLRHEAWLIRKRAVSVLPSVSSLRLLRVVLPEIDQKTTKRGGLFMMADPNFSGPGSPPKTCARRSVPMPVSAYFTVGGSFQRAVKDLCRLPGTATEGSQLKAQLGGKLITGDEARESELRTADNVAAMGSAEVVSFATHGLLVGDTGLGEPALALAPAIAGEPDDGMLTASDAATLRLSAEWVLLSACNTASPDIFEARGLSGLARGFFYAGAKSLLVSHWRIDDTASAALVVETIRLHKEGGLSKAEALRQASLAMMEGRIGSGDEYTALPAFWAPFVLIGDGA